jgi:tRNA (guanine-N7-)-methyltransferase
MHAGKKKVEDRRQHILFILVMSNRIRRHVDPFQCRIAIKPEDWLRAYEIHGRGDIWLDLGCGKGEFLAGLAAILPQVFFIGVEVRKRIAERYFPRYGHLGNLVLLHGNVNLSIPSMMDRRRVQRVFIHFPDPYSHKDRYKKRRLVNEVFVKGLCDILAPGGTVSVKTDDLPLFEDMDALLSAHLETATGSLNPAAEATVLTEWEQECMRKSMPIYSREYRLR